MTSATTIFPPVAVIGDSPDSLFVSAVSGIIEKLHTRVSCVNDISGLKEEHTMIFAVCSGKGPNDILLHYLIQNRKIPVILIVPEMNEEVISLCRGKILTDIITTDSVNEKY